MILWVNVKMLLGVARGERRSLTFVEKVQRNLLQNVFFWCFDSNSTFWGLWNVVFLSVFTLLQDLEERRSYQQIHRGKLKQYSQISLLCNLDWFWNRASWHSTLYPRIPIFKNTVLRVFQRTSQKLSLIWHLFSTGWV